MDLENRDTPNLYASLLLRKPESRWKPMEGGTLDCGIAAFEPIPGAHFILPLYLGMSIPFEGADHQSHLQILSDCYITCFHPPLPYLWSIVTMQRWIRRLAQLHLPLPLCKLKAFGTMENWSALFHDVFSVYIFSRFLEWLFWCVGKDAMNLA